MNGLITRLFPFQRSTRKSHCASHAAITCDQKEDTEKTNTRTMTQVSSSTFKKPKNKSPHQWKQARHQGKYRLQIPCFRRWPGPARGCRPNKVKTPMCWLAPLARATPRHRYEPLERDAWNPMRARSTIMVPFHQQCHQITVMGHAYFMLTPGL